MKSVSRRVFNALVGAAPLALPSSVESGIPKGLGATIRGMSSANLYVGVDGYKAQDQRDEGKDRRDPRMSRGDAIRFVVRTDPAAMDAYVSSLYERERVVTHLDPDLEIKRSFSPMAKITFQRQRNVERLMKCDGVGGISRPFSALFETIIEKLRGAS